MRKKKKHIRLLIVTGVLVIGAGALFAGRHMILEQVRTKAAVEISKRILTEQFGKQVDIGGQQVDVSQVVDNMDEEDIETITEIAEKYISPENLMQAAEMAVNGDTEGLKALTGEQISQEDKERLQGLYEKYKDQIPSNIP